MFLINWFRKIFLIPTLRSPPATMTSHLAVTTPCRAVAGDWAIQETIDGEGLKFGAAQPLWEDFPKIEVIIPFPSLHATSSLLPDTTRTAS
jgi:hypothetical protein